MVLLMRREGYNTVGWSRRTWWMYSSPSFHWRGDTSRYVSTTSWGIVGWSRTNRWWRQWLTSWVTGPRTWDCTPVSCWYLLLSLLLVSPPQSPTVSCWYLLLILLLISPPQSPAVLAVKELHRRLTLWWRRGRRGRSSDSLILYCAVLYSTMLYCTV